MKCKVCGKEITKGQRYPTKDLISYYFCSEQCYDNYKNKDKTVGDRRKLTDYILSIYPQSSKELNWKMLLKQVKQYEEEYNLTDKDVLLILRYAMIYEQHKLLADKGLGQFIPFYIDPCNQFIEAIERNKSVENCEIPHIFIGKNVQHKQHLNIDTEWED